MTKDVLDTYGRMFSLKLGRNIIFSHNYNYLFENKHSEPDSKLWKSDSL